MDNLEPCPCGTCGAGDVPPCRRAVTRQTYVVAVYNVGQCYGGPEEGGWWYDAGTLIRAVRVFRDEDAAYAYCRRLNHKLGRGVDGLHPESEWGLNGRRGNYPPSSTRADEFLSAEVYENTAPLGFPDRRPHYE